MDRSRLARDLAKAQAFVACGKLDKAMEHVACLLSAFREAGVDVEYAFRLSEAIESKPASDWIS
jgi:hypothetical protein